MLAAHTTKPSSDIKRIALIMTPYGRDGIAVRGIARFARERPEWRTYLLDRDWSDPRRPLGDYEIHGMIAMISRLPIPHSRWKIPLVGISPGRARLNMVVVDDPAVGRLAAEHMVSLGLRNLAYVGPSERLYASSLRYRSFLAEATRRNCSVTHFNAEKLWDFSKHEQELDRLASFLAQQPRPMGVWCFNANVGVYASRAAARAALHIPQDVAILGTDDDPVQCEIAFPRLSSINTDMERVGYNAARRLDDLMRQPAAAPTLTRIAPLGIMQRASTDVIAYDDADVVAAVRFIRRHACTKGFQTADVLDHVMVSRTGLEAKFAASVGHSIDAEIWHTRTDRACRLLTDTDWTLMRIASEAGFSTVAHLCRTIKKRTGMTTKTYRRQRMLQR